MFESRGYQATTVGAITTAAHTAHGTFYLYFKNKEDAFARVIADVIEEMYREAGPLWEGDVRSTLSAAIRRHVKVFSAHRGLWRCLLEATHQSKAIETMWLDLRRPFIERIAANLIAPQQAGHVRAMDAAVAANALGAMVEWFAFTHFELDEPSPADVSLDTVVETLTDLWMHAVYGTANAPH